jgi:hypothetical protein
MKRPRVRHHTNDAGLAGIQRDGFILVSRGWGNLARGVHVEIEPFGATRPYREGRHPSPKKDLGLVEDGAFVEFDVPPGDQLLLYSCGVRQTALIATERPLSLAGLNPRFVKVRRARWQFWRAMWE